MNKHILESKEKTITTLTLGSNKNEHIITKKDRFLDNGICIQLLKELPMKLQYPGDSLVLDKVATKETERFEWVAHKKHEFTEMGGNNAKVYSLFHLDERFHIMGYGSQNDVDNKKGYPLGAEGYYQNAVAKKEQIENVLYQVKIFDSEMSEINY
jgi:hypothetical protein